ncbi:hypothetical protein NGA_0628002, partial [Nannochloropsis gaditana CCMP526]|uniref:uncharacterized protein n=1 Tax=Nannochloropsis gaditana (strain CCMP526) TaxID=1093141 RepID=UPI00029F6313
MTGSELNQKCSSSSPAPTTSGCAGQYRKKMKKKKQSRSDLSVSGGPSHSPPPFH